MSRPAAERLKQINVLLLDVDGVLTDGRVIYSDSGQELQAFHIRDGSGLALWRKAGKRAAVITGRGSKALERRAGELALSPVIMHAEDKAAAMRSVLDRLRVDAHQVAAVGDDLPDLAVMKRAGLAFAVADACAEVRSAADFVTEQRGGFGAVRDIVEMVLKAQDLWSGLVDGHRR